MIGACRRTHARARRPESSPGDLEVRGREQAELPHVAPSEWVTGYELAVVGAGLVGVAASIEAAGAGPTGSSSRRRLETCSLGSRLRWFATAAPLGQEAAVDAEQGFLLCRGQGGVGADSRLDGGGAAGPLLVLVEQARLGEGGLAERLRPRAIERSARTEGWWRPRSTWLR